MDLSKFSIETFGMRNPISDGDEQNIIGLARILLWISISNSSDDGLLKWRQIKVQIPNAVKQFIEEPSSPPGIFLLLQVLENEVCNVGQGITLNDFLATFQLLEIVSAIGDSLEPIVRKMAEAETIKPYICINYKRVVNDANITCQDEKLFRLTELPAPVKGVGQTDTTSLVKEPWHEVKKIVSHAASKARESIVGFHFEALVIAIRKETTSLFLREIHSIVNGASISVALRTAIVDSVTESKNKDKTPYFVKNAFSAFLSNEDFALAPNVAMSYPQDLPYAFTWTLSLLSGYIRDAINTVAKDIAEKQETTHHLSECVKVAVNAAIKYVKSESTVSAVKVAFARGGSDGVLLAMPTIVKESVKQAQDTFEAWKEVTMVQIFIDQVYLFMVLAACIVDPFLFFSSAIDKTAFCVYSQKFILSWYLLLRTGFDFFKIAHLAASVYSFNRVHQGSKTLKEFWLEGILSIPCIPLAIVYGFIPAVAETDGTASIRANLIRLSILLQLISRMIHFFSREEVVRKRILFFKSPVWRIARSGVLYLLCANIVGGIWYMEATERWYACAQASCLQQSGTAMYIRLPSDHTTCFDFLNCPNGDPVSEISGDRQAWINSGNIIHGSFNAQFFNYGVFAPVVPAIFRGLSLPTYFLSLQWGLKQSTSFGGFASPSIFIPESLFVMSTSLLSLFLVALLIDDVKKVIRERSESHTDWTNPSSLASS